MKKQELLNILEGYETRAAIRAEKKKQHNKKTKEWKERESSGLNPPLGESRRSCYLGPPGPPASVKPSR